jgi:hypothetical protein
MSSAGDIQAMLDDVYGVAGIPCQWTPAGGAALVFTALELGGDQVAQMRGMVGSLNVSARILKARTAELATLAPGVAPLRDDAIALLDDNGAVTASFLVTGDPRQEDPRRLEWTLELADA